MSLLSASTDVPGPFNRWIRHLAAGGAGTLLYMLLVALFVEAAGVHPVTGVVFAFLILELYTYAVNRVWVYAPKNGHGYAIPRFLAVTAIALLLNAGIVYLIVEALGLWYVWGLAATAMVVPLTNFLLNYYWAFR